MNYSPSLVELASLPGILRRQWWSAERLRQFQSRRLRKLVQHAWENVPYYRAAWEDAGVTPGDIQSVDDLCKLPTIDSTEFKKAPREQLIASGIDPAECVQYSTSGSTGVPLVILFRRRDHFEIVKAMSIRHFRAHGAGMFTRTIGFTPIAPPVRKPLLHRMRLWQRWTLSTLSDSREWLSELEMIDPHIVSGSTMSLIELAEQRRVTGTAGNGAKSPRMIFCSGARLEPADRRRIEDGLNAPVVDVYGAFEGGYMAWECRTCDAYHVNCDSTIVEVMDGDRVVKPGETGEVVITNLNSFAMPFIRYRLSDLVTLSQKPVKCGRGLPLIDTIWGRCDDSLRLPSGAVIGIYPVYRLINSNPWIKEFHLLQQADGSCLLRLVAHTTSEETKQKAEQVREALEQVVRKEVPVRVLLYDSIERDLTTKWKAICSHVN